MKIKVTFKNGTVEEYTEVTSVTWERGKLVISLSPGAIVIHTKFLYSWVIV